MMKKLCKFMYHRPADTPEKIAVRFYCRKWLQGTILKFDELSGGYEILNNIAVQLLLNLIEYFRR